MLGGAPEAHEVLSKTPRVSFFSTRRLLPRRFRSRLATNRELVLLWFALQRLANREQEDGTLVFRMRRKEVNYIIVEEGQPGRTQVLGIRSQVDPAADDACLQLDGPIAAVSVSLQNTFQIGEKEDGHAGVRRQLLLQTKMMGLGSEFPVLQKLQGALLAPEEVCARLEPPALNARSGRDR